jgi:hypothetical protein
MRISALVTFANDSIPELYIFQHLHDSLVVAMFEGIGVSTDGAGEKICVLRKADKSRADSLARDMVKRKSINVYATPREVEHAEVSEDFPLDIL